jgi:hypothetical protein
MRSVYYLTVHIQKQEQRFIYKMLKHNKRHICNFNWKSGFPLFFKNSFCVQVDAEKSLHPLSSSESLFF